jgi:hypothetical protein
VTNPCVRLTFEEKQLQDLLITHFLGGSGSGCDRGLGNLRDMLIEGVSHEPQSNKDGFCRQDQKQ